MTIAEGREEIVAALNSAAGISAFSTRPRALTVGSAWPRWRGFNRSDGSTGLMLSSWDCYVVVGRDELAADTFVDERGADLMDALQPAGWVTAIEPYQIVTDQGPMFAVQITITRE
jgi:hypothetical protein